MRVVLVGNAGPLAGREFSLDAPVVRIGRRDDNDIVVKEPTVSRQHAEIRQEGDRPILRDLGSSSGTFVNGIPLNEDYRLRDGDFIMFGIEAVFMVHLLPDAPDAPPVDAAPRLSRETLAQLTLIGPPPSFTTPAPAEITPTPAPAALNPPPMPGAPPAAGPGSRRGLLIAALVLLILALAVCVATGLILLLRFR